MTYLPKTHTAIMEYRTLAEIFEISQKLTMQGNMRYTHIMRYAHITLDVGAAIKAFHVVSNDEDRWSNIVVHLRDFHALMAWYWEIRDRQWV